MWMRQFQTQSNKLKMYVELGSAHNSLHNLSVCLVLSGMCSSFSQTVQAYSIARFEKHVFLLHATRGSISLECFSYIP